MLTRISVQIRLRQVKESNRGAKAFFLQMHKSARELDKSLVELVIRGALILEPEFFENVMGFEKELFIEAAKVPDVLGRVDLSLATDKQGGDLS
jgi:hypothetical protein